MLVLSPAKINLGLYVTEKRSDGYHNIQTCFYPIPLFDVVEIVESEELKLSEYGNSTKTDFENNLCIKAYKLLKEDFKLPSVYIHLLKNIPIEAGLGGGSSNAAATLKLLNTMFDLNLTEEQLFEYALKLGSDCPFFIIQKPVLAYGRGEIFSPINLDLSALFIIIVKPPFGISTSLAYQNVTINNKIDLTKKIELPIDKWKDELENVFENYFFSIHPELKFIKDIFYKNGAIYSAMSGSGSAFYGLFDKKIDLKNFFPDDWFYFSSMLDAKC